MSSTILRGYPRLIPLILMVIKWSHSILMVMNDIDQPSEFKVYEEARSWRWEEGLWTSIWTHQDIPVLSTYTSWYYQSSSLSLLIALLLKSYSYRDIELYIISLFVWGMQQESLGREQLVCLKMMRDRHAQRLILVPSSKFVGYGSVDEDDEAKWLEAPYINQSK